MVRGLGCGTFSSLGTLIAASFTLPVSRSSYAFLLSGRMPAFASGTAGLTRDAQACRRGTGRRHRNSLVGELDSEQRPADDHTGMIAFRERDHGTRPTRATAPR